MSTDNRLNAFQIIGLFLSVIGLIFIAFPTIVGVLAVRILTMIFILIGFYGLTFAFFIKSKLTIMTSILTLLVGVYAFINPDQVLFMIGVACVLSALNGIILYLKGQKKRDEKAIISSVILLLLGVFSILNSKAALATVVLILGIIIVIIGMIVFFLGKQLIFRKAKQYQQYTAYEEHSGSKVIVNIDSDEVEEIEYKDVN